MASRSKHLCCALLLHAAAWTGCAFDSEVSDDAGPSTGFNTDTATECSPEQAAAQHDALTQAVHAFDPCFNGYVFTEGGVVDEILFELVGCMPAGGFMECHDSYPHSAQIAQIVQGFDLSCWDGEPLYIQSPDAGGELYSLFLAVEEHECDFPHSTNHHVVVVIGEDGTVAEVYAVGEVEPLVLECVAEALTGLVFPCLAGLDLCSCDFWYE